MDAILLDAIEYNGGGINTLLNKGAVKSVQRGIFNYHGSGTASGLIKVENIATFSRVDVSKSVLISEVGSDDFGTSKALYYRSVELTESGINLYFQSKSMGYSYDVYGSWQVIEFY